MAKDSKKILIAAGGTGGHILPALSLAHYFPKEDVVWLGSSRDVEKTILSNTPWPTHSLVVKPFRGVKLVAAIQAFMSLCYAFFQTGYYFVRYRPSGVITTGGYVSFTAGVWAKLLGIPLFLCEQNCVPGWTNRLLAPLATTIYTAYEGVFASYKHKVMAYGNPLRRVLVDYHLANSDKGDLADRSGFHILVMGGSQGSQFLNRVMPEIIADLKLSAPVSVTHQCGAADHLWLTQAYVERSIDASVHTFIDDIYNVYQTTDLVIARAGALTISEILAMGLSSILVPLPGSRDDHQLCNALYYQKRGAVSLIAQSQFKGVAVKHIQSILMGASVRDRMSRCALREAKPHAARDIVSHCSQHMDMDIVKDDG